ncbi:competence protein ComGC [Evansella vedderi]|uniref:Competence protein ComGC n=1 Tax=Evansella vedderi TaxID=38282 RepID=A0ABT9ZZV1_9BACI|nr:competence type IV pilus major pilin ComGC [Evansella vedderi]MDQ0256287.1 competence protein ComGC [Evansella vedderi]
MTKLMAIIHKFLKKEHGFTLIEMMIVLVIISILLLVAVPNLAKNQATANAKGCEATIDLIRSQKLAYEIETGENLTDLQKLVEEEYVDTLTCPNGEPVNDNMLKFSTRTTTP